jgi:hypothetical protein
MPGIGLTFGFRAAIVLATVVGGYLLFEFGRLQAEYNIVDAISDRRAYEVEIQGLEDQIVALKQEIALQETHRDIDREAYQVVEGRFAELELKIQEQNDAIAFYRGIVSPKDGSRGLRVQDLKLSRGKDERSYKLRVVLVQVMQHDRTVKGVVDVNLEGAQDGVATSYTLSQLLPEDSDSNWPFAFRYFQDFDRELVLPDGFMPEKINIEVISTTKSISSVKQSFDWLIGQS